jgi:hypothetical protein
MMEETADTINKNQPQHAWAQAVSYRTALDWVAEISDPLFPSIILATPERPATVIITEQEIID